MYKKFLAILIVAAVFLSVGSVAIAAPTIGHATLTPRPGGFFENGTATFKLIAPGVTQIHLEMSGLEQRAVYFAYVSTQKGCSIYDPKGTIIVFHVAAPIGGDFVANKGGTFVGTTTEPFNWHSFVSIGVFSFEFEKSGRILGPNLVACGTIH